MKKLVIITHPDIESSNVNRTWKQELDRHPESFQTHLLYERYPDLSFDIQAEQQLLSQFEEIIFQFPIHWYSTPFALKKYIDQVLSFGWAFGPGGDELQGKRIGFAVSTGGDKSSYCSPQGVSVSALLNDVLLSFEYCGCTITHIHTFYGALEQPTNESLYQNSAEYLNSFLD